MADTYKTPGLQESVDSIVDTIACSDGGATFVTLLSVIRQLDTEESPAAAITIDLVMKFARLCRVAEKLAHGEKGMSGKGVGIR